MDRAATRTARRALPGLIAALALAACGGDEPANDPEAVASMLREAAQAAGDRDSDKACDRLTSDAQTQIVLLTGGRLGNVDCPAAVGRALLFLSPLERARIGSLEPTEVRVTGDSGTAVLRSATGDASQPIVVPLSVRREEGDWKIAGFGENAQGVPGF